MSYYDDLSLSSSSSSSAFSDPSYPQPARRSSRRRDRWDDDEPAPTRTGTRSSENLARAELEGDGRDGVDLVLTTGVDLALDPYLDDLGPDRRWSTWHSVEKGARGPDPLPSWVVTADAAIDTELGILKTGKEADVFLLRRAVPDAVGAAGHGRDAASSCLLAAKRYRSREHRSFHRDSIYTEDRRVRRTRDQRALDRKSDWGRLVAQGQWAAAEFEALGELWSAGVPVPYPVQVDGTEVLMEFIADPGGTGDGAAAAPRLAQTRPDPDLLAHYWDQVEHAMTTLARLGYAHGDLSPYNVLADGDRLVVIDVPQIVDLAANPFSTDLLHRDCRTMAAWFTARGLAVDDDELLARLLAAAW